MRYALAAFMQRLLLRFDLIQWAKIAVRVAGSRIRDPYRHDFFPDFASDRGVKVHAFSIEPQAYCNRSCEFCPRHLDFERPYRVDASGKKLNYRIPMARLEKLLDEIRDVASVPQVCISPIGLNEPFEDERIYTFVKAVKQRGFLMYMVSNGDVVEKNPALLKQCLPYIDTIKFGIYYDPTTAAGQRAIEQRKVMIKQFMTAVMHEQGRSIPVEYSVASRKFWHPDTYLFKGRAIKYPCFLQADVGAYYLNARGDVSVCCRDVISDGPDSLCIGNIFKESLREILYSKKHKSILANLYAGQRHKYLRCSSCVYSIGVYPRLASAQDVSYYRMKILKRNSREEIEKILNRYNRFSYFRGGLFERNSPPHSALSPELEVFNPETNEWHCGKV